MVKYFEASKFLVLVLLFMHRVKRFGVFCLVSREDVAVSWFGGTPIQNNNNICVG